MLAPLRALLLALAAVLSVLLPVSPAAAGGGVSGPEFCQVQQGGRLGSDGSTLTTFHQTLCHQPRAVGASVSSKTFRNGTLVSSRSARTCRAGSYDGLCKGTSGSVVTRNHSDVVCIQTRVDYTVEGRKQEPDLETSCWTRGARAATYANLKPLSVGVGCDPAMMFFRESGQVKTRHLSTCSDKVDEQSMYTMISRNTSYTRMAQQTAYREKTCTAPAARSFNCTGTRAIADRSTQDLYCALTEVSWTYRYTNKTMRDFGKSCWYA